METKKYSECKYCLYKYNERLESVGCKCSQIRFAFNKMLLELPVFNMFADTSIVCKHYSRDLFWDGE